MINILSMINELHFLFFPFLYEMERIEKEGDYYAKMTDPVINQNCSFFFSFSP